MDSVSIADLHYRNTMERGSRHLSEAISWARKGYNPGTSTDAFKLPPDWSNREQRIAQVKERASPRPCNERVREMMERNLKAGQIARELKINVQKVTWMMQAIKLQRRREDF